MRFRLSTFIIGLLSMGLGILAVFIAITDRSPSFALAVVTPLVVTAAVVAAIVSASRLIWRRR